MIDEKKLIEELKFQINNCETYGHSDIYIDLEMAKKWVETIEKKKVGEWIPVEERLPEIQQDVLVTIKRRNISYCDLAFLDDNGRWLMSRRIGYIEGNVLAWQPLPEPYRVPLEKNSKGEQND